MTEPAQHFNVISKCPNRGLFFWQTFVLEAHFIMCNLRRCLPEMLVTLCESFSLTRGIFNLYFGAFKRLHQPLCRPSGKLKYFNYFLSFFSWEHELQGPWQPVSLPISRDLIVMSSDLHLSSRTFRFKRAEELWGRSVRWEASPAVTWIIWGARLTRLRRLCLCPSLYLSVPLPTPSPFSFTSLISNSFAGFNWCRLFWKGIYRR